MEKIAIDGKVYDCPKGTNEKIRSAVQYAEQASPEEHEHGTAYKSYNDMLFKIKLNNQSMWLDGYYSSY